jgi:ABC-type Fe3+/spermidine/putrescine transport system ATPase subunit
VSSETNGPLLEIRSVAKRFGAVTVLSGISLAVAPGEFLTVLGASGSGKTTLLRLIAGFEEPDAGEIWMAGQCLDGLPPYRRRVNTVFQSYALFPHLSVFENVAYGPRVGGAARAEVPALVKDALAMVKMSDFAARAPRQLSGGQQQRVALARALVNRPQLLLLDEPLSALDANLRREMQSELKALQREVGISFVFVTHDQEEAMALSDRIALLRAGELEQVAPPREIYRRPVSVYAAQFIGQTNLLRGQIADGVARCGALAWPIVDGARASELAVFSLRPESIRLADSSVAPQASGTLPSADAANGSGRARFRATVRRQTFGGALDLLELECAGGSSLLARLPTPGPLEGEQCFEFSGEDAVRVRDDGSRSPEPGAPPQGRS